MTKEQEEAIEMLEDIKNNTWTTKYIMSSDSKKAETVLNMLKENSAEIEKKNTELAEKNAEIEKKNKQIKLMAQTILENTSELKTFWCNGCTQIANCPYKEAVDCIEDFF